jgi:hypothetical protein
LTAAVEATPDSKTRQERITFEQLGIDSLLVFDEGGGLIAAGAKFAPHADIEQVAAICKTFKALDGRF